MGSVRLAGSPSLGGRIRWVNWHLPTIENKYTDDDFHNSEYDTAGVIGRRAREVGISQTVQLRSGQPFGGDSLPLGVPTESLHHPCFKRVGETVREHLVLPARACLARIAWYCLWTALRGMV